MKSKLPVVSILFVLIFTTLHLEGASIHKKREMRAVWIATVENIDWPPKDSSTKEQQDALRTMLDQLAVNNINTVVFQIRPTADALYLQC